MALDALMEMNGICMIGTRVEGTLVEWLDGMRAMSKSMRSKG